MITDHAKVVQYADEKALMNAYDDIARSPTKWGERHSLSAAQVALFSLGYGGSAAVRSWQGLEDASALFCAMRLWGMIGATRGALVQLFHPAAKVSDAHFAKPVAYTGVKKVIHLRSKLEGAGIDNPITGVLCRVAALIEEGYAVVLVNGGQCASYADVIVVTKGLVVLAQCKYYGTGTAFGTANLVNELRKMGYPCSSSAATASEASTNEERGAGMTARLSIVAASSGATTSSSAGDSRKRDRE